MSRYYEGLSWQSSYAQNSLQSYSNPSSEPSSQSMLQRHQSDSQPTLNSGNNYIVSQPNSSQQNAQRKNGDNSRLVDAVEGRRHLEVTNGLTAVANELKEWKEVAFKTTSNLESDCFAQMQPVLEILTNNVNSLQQHSEMQEHAISKIQSQLDRIVASIEGNRNQISQGTSNLSSHITAFTTAISELSRHQSHSSRSVESNAYNMPSTTKTTAIPTASNCRSSTSTIKAKPVRAQSGTKAIVARTTRAQGKAKLLQNDKVIPSISQKALLNATKTKQSPHSPANSAVKRSHGELTTPNSRNSIKDMVDRTDATSIEDDINLADYFIHLQRKKKKLN